MSRTRKHKWFKFRGFKTEFTCCRDCGVVRRADGKNADKQCKGRVGVSVR